MTRREFVAAAAAAQAPGFPPVRAITRGPKLHWFGYYDKLQFDPAGRYALGMEVDFEHRSPRPEDVIRIGMVDLRSGDRWTELGVSGPVAQSESVSVRHANRPADRARALFRAAGIQGRVAVRPAPALQPGRAEGDHRFRARRRPADVPDRYL